jgi:23S rRNA (guanosine2251-2'-O)-methyltransferase
MRNESIIYGLRPVIEAINAGREIDKLLIQKGLSGNLYFELRNVLRNTSIPVQYVPVEKLNRIVKSNHQGVIAFVSLIEFNPVEKVIPGLYEEGKDPFVLILDRISDVRNMGAIARTAECAGVDLLILPVKGSAQINADAMKTSAGAINSIRISRSKNLKKTIQFLKDYGISIIACSEKGKNYYHNISFKKPVAIIMGSEENGISPSILDIADNTVRIPIKGEINSLNVSVAAGIILYEVVKQRDDS